MSTELMDIKEKNLMVSSMAETLIGSEIIKIGNQVKIQAQSGVNHAAKDGETLYGSPAINYSDYRRNYVHFRNFTDIVKRINDLENKKSE